MLDDWWKKLYPHLFKKPCKTCLVQATCRAPAEPWKRQSCDLKNKWRHREYKVETFLNNVELTFFGLFFIGGILICVVTFFLGFWKWYDIGKMILS